jgi:DNA-binding NtrC family response regulator
MDYRFLLITKNAGAQWTQTVEKAVASLGTLDVWPDSELDRLIGHVHHHLIIVDASSIVKFTPLVERLHDLLPQTYLIVATASPTWQRARDALKAGASDYIRKTMDAKELRGQLMHVLCIESSRNKG